MDKLLNWEDPKAEDSRVALAVLTLAILGFLAYFFAGSPVDYPTSIAHHSSAQQVMR